MSKLKELKKRYSEKLKSLKATTSRRRREELELEIAELDSEISKKKESKSEKKREEASPVKKAKCDICGEEFEFDVVCYPDIFHDVDRELCLSDKVLFDLPYDGLNFQGTMKGQKVYCQSCTERKFKELPIRSPK